MSCELNEWIWFATIPEIRVENQSKWPCCQDDLSCVEPFPIENNVANRNWTTNRMLRFGQSFAGDSLWCKTPDAFQPKFRQAISRNRDRLLGIDLHDRFAVEWCQSNPDNMNSKSDDSLDEQIDGIQIQLAPWWHSTTQREILNVKRMLWELNSLKKVSI